MVRSCDNVVHMGNYSRASACDEAIRRTAIPIVAGTAVHITVWFLAYLPQCGVSTAGVGATDVSCAEGSAALAWTALFIVIGFVGVPLGMGVLLRRAGQVHPWLIAIVVEVALPLLGFAVIADSLFREAVTQLIAVPTVVILLGLLFGRRNSGSTIRLRTPRVA
jgi:predicted permease